jgi:penicillin-insensitive murein endopeptidase
VARRFLALLALTLATACAGSAATVSAQGSAQDSTRDSAQDLRPVARGEAPPDAVAKHLFGAAALPSSQPPEPIGGTSRGCQAGAVALPETGPTWQAMRLSRNRHWAQPATVDFVQDLSRVAATLPGWRGLYVGDMSQPRGGPMTSGHVSHQTGLDVDLWLRPATDLTLSPQAREEMSSTDMQRAGGAHVNDAWTPAHEALLRAAAEDPRVERIFVFPGAKVEMCDNATGDRSWLSKIRPYWGHNTHVHIRLRCPQGARNCTPQDPVPPGDGCDEARRWQADILNPPPPDPDAPAPAPRRDLTMADLPAACAAVLAAP